MTNNTSNIISSFCEIYLLNKNEQQRVFRQFVKLCEASSPQVRDEEIFTGLNSIKLYFYTSMDKTKHRKYVECCLWYISQKKEFYYQLIETLSVIYKELEDTLQALIFDEFSNCFESLLKTHRGITTISIFIKNTHKVYTNNQRTQLDRLLKLLQPLCIGELKDTYNYCKTNIGRVFTPTTNKILLLIPEFQTATSFVQPPLCYLAVGSQLQKEGIPFDILDNRVYSYSIEQLTDIASNYSIIACTSSPLDQVQTYFCDHRYSIFCKTINSLQLKLSYEQKIIVCGAHSTVRSDIVCKDIHPNIILLGEYDIQLYLLLLCVYQGENLDEFPNILIHKNDNDYSINKSDSNAAHPKEWSHLQINYQLIHSYDYFGYHFVGNTHVKKMGHAVVQATRGCPFHCIFCYNFYSHSMRYKDINILVRELKTLMDTGFEEFFFIDQTFTVNLQYVQDLCKSMIDNNIGLKWTCETRIELIDEPTIKIMKKAGCVGIWFGVESFDESVLNINKKGYVKSDYLKTINLLEKYGVDYRAFIMLGMKGDTKESLQKTIDTIIQNKIHISKTIVRCKVRFGTELFDEIPIELKKRLNSFETLGVYKGELTTLTSKEISEAEQRLMILNRS
ncbi:MAG: radical SAM protein [Bacteroidales bacterium]|nr:radical SAM protein [Bacteroidales bacterium]